MVKTRCKKSSIFAITLFALLVSTFAILPSISVAGNASATELEPDTNTESDVLINVTLGDSLSLALDCEDGFVAISAVPDRVAESPEHCRDVLVMTSNSLGYTLKLRTETAETSLIEETTSSEIVAGTGTFASPTTLNPGEWGYRIESDDPDTDSAEALFDNGKYAGITASPVTIRTVNNITDFENPSVTRLIFGTKTDFATPAGTYKNAFVVIAETNV